MLASVFLRNTFLCGIFYSFDFFIKNIFNYRYWEDGCNKRKKPLICTPFLHQYYHKNLSLLLWVLPGIVSNLLAVEAIYFSGEMGITRCDRIINNQVWLTWMEAMLWNTERQQLKMVSANLNMVQDSWTKRMWKVRRASEKNQWQTWNGVVFYSLTAWAYLDQRK